MLIPATINRVCKTPTISFNYRQLIDVLMDHLSEDLDEKLQLKDSEIYYDVVYSMTDNDLGRYNFGSCVTYSRNEDPSKMVYVINICITDINNAIIKLNDTSPHMFCVIVMDTIVHEYRHIWQNVNGVYNDHEIIMPYTDDWYEVYPDLPYEIDAREYSKQYSMGSDLLDKLTNDVIQNMIDNNYYMISAFIDINRFLSEEYASSIMISLFSRSDDIQYIKFIPHYFDTNRFEKYGHTLTVYYNPMIFDFDSLQDRSLDSISRYITNTIMDMSYEYASIPYKYNKECTDSVYEAIRIHLPLYIYLIENRRSELC